MLWPRSAKKSKKVLRTLMPVHSLAMVCEAAYRRGEETTREEGRHRREGGRARQLTGTRLRVWGLRVEGHDGGSRDGEGAKVEKVLVVVVLVLVVVAAVLVGSWQQ